MSKTRPDKKRQRQIGALNRLDKSMHYGNKQEKELQSLTLIKRINETHKFIKR